MKSKRTKRTMSEHSNFSKAMESNDEVQPLETEVSVKATSQIQAKGTIEPLHEDVEHSQKRRVQLRKEQFHALHQEMELVSYGVSETGQARRKYPRHLSVERTKKRRLLEQQDRKNANTQQNNNIGPSRTLRGSKAAAEDEVLRESLIYGPKSALSDVDDESLSPQEEDEFGAQTDSDEIDDFIGESDNDILDGLDEPIAQKRMLKSPGSKKSSSVKFTKPKLGKTARLHRLRNFKSTKMAEKHGEALGAHVQGKPALAIRRLKQVATLAPSAPQIYSSLGMVYEDLLQESQRKCLMTESSSVIDSNRKASPPSDTKDQRLSNDAGFSDVDHPSHRDKEMLISTEHHAAQVRELEIHDKILREQLNLARKAYGSYHVAAILCKRDYSLWLRAADSAYEIATLHTTIMRLPDIPSTIVEYHRAEKLRWLEEAKNDYQSADNLNPPGIEIPAKLAHVMIELGMVSEALTLLTGLKKHADFACSYRAWLLFADLMLRIGHECNQWNCGIQTNSNYMFRRWLRKLSTSFDWKERRLQALSKALEAASGSECCKELLSWITNRVKRMHSSSSDDGNNYVSDSPQEVSKTNSEEILPTDNLYDCFTNTDPAVQSSKEILPLAASCRIVFSIASELMRHMIDMNLYLGGRLVGESVSLYLKKRQEICDLRKQKKFEFDSLQQKPTSLFAMQPESYDVSANGMESDSESGRDAPLSDDENWDNDNNDELRPLRKGVLPLEIKFLYGLCLAGQGKDLFLAKTCIDAIKFLPLESPSFLEDRVVDCGVNLDSQWIVFHEAMTQPYGRLAALSLVFDVLCRCNEEYEIGVNLVSLFQQQMVALGENGLLQKALDWTGDKDFVCSYRRNHVAKVLLASVRYGLFPVDSREGHSNEDKPGVTSRSIRAWIVTLSNVIKIAWRVEPDGSVTETCILIIDVLSRILNLYANELSGLGTEESTMNHIFQIFAALSGVSCLTLTDEVENLPPNLKNFPMTSSWLSSNLEALTNMAFNLCVGMNVAQFSGWETDKFSLRLVSRTGDRNFFGITSDDGPISGFVSTSVEEELVNQWKLVQKHHAPDMTFSFHEKLLHLKESEWYTETRENYEAARKRHVIFRYGEDFGLSVLLGFSRLCLSLDQRENKRLFHTALSIIMPISQFCLGEPLWDAVVGQHLDPGFTEVRDWNDLLDDTKQDHVAPSNRPGYIRPSKRHLLTSSNPNGEKALHDWFNWENEQRPISNLVKISLACLLDQWRRGPEPASGESSTEANKIMREIDELMSQMRLCYTLQAVERVSIKIASSLLKLIVSPFCRNPFSCIQQAAMFASLGPKRGLADHLFQARLPRPDACTSNRALLILGRAECLNALHFCFEASFLCCYVARICGLHLNGKEVTDKACQRWHVLSYLTYNLSVTIRITASLLLEDPDKREDTSGAWDKTVVDLLHRFRLNALASNDRIESKPNGYCTIATSESTPQTLPNPENGHSVFEFSNPSVEFTEPEIEATAGAMTYLVEV